MFYIKTNKLQKRLRTIKRPDLRNDGLVNWCPITKNVTRHHGRLYTVANEPLYSR